MVVDFICVLDFVVLLVVCWKCGNGIFERSCWGGVDIIINEDCWCLYWMGYCFFEVVDMGVGFW